MTIDELLDRLEDVQPSGTGFVAICPAHDDSAASLSHRGGRGAAAAQLLRRLHAGRDPRPHSG
jgi:hypothetical protein